MTVITSPLVSTQWLADHLGAESLLVVDASVLNHTQPDGRSGYLSGHELYLLEGHIPGAVFADLLEEFADPDGAFPVTRPSAERFAAAASALGIGPDTTVIVYDSTVGQWAARFWWILRSFGHDAAAVLDGGLTAWRTEDRQLDIGHVEPTPATFVGAERSHLWVDKSYVEGIVRGDHEAALVCASPPKEFSGEVARRGRAGHIPGSSSAPAAFLVDRERRTSLPPDRLRELLAPALGAPKIVTYCSGGIAAAAAALALTVLGEQDVAVYDGSLNEWGADANAPLVTTV
jgi:thiosulfate/3-mercaptopyruvate sulfurtransferase